MRPGSTLLAALLANFLAACGGDGSSGSRQSEITIPVAGGRWESAMKEAYFDPFTRETGIAVRAIRGGDDPVALLEAQRVANRVQLDLIVLDDAAIARWTEAFEDHRLELPDDLLLPMSFPEKTVPVQSYPSWVIACNKELVSRCPQTYSEFFDDEAFPGDRSIPNLGILDASGVLETALLGDGVAPDELYPMDLDRAFESLETISDSIRVFWTSFAASQDVLRSGEAAIVLMTDGRAHQLKLEQGMDLSISYHGASTVYAHWVMPKGAPNPEGARRFLQWAMEHPEAEAIFSSKTYFGPVSARGLAAADRMGIKNHSMANVEETRILSRGELEQISAWIAENGGTMMDRWNEFVSR